MSDWAEGDRQRIAANAYYSEGALGASTYDMIYAPLVDELVAFYVACAKRFGGPVLELGAGTGLVAWAVAEAGIEVLACDLSPAMLAAARSKADRQTATARARIAFLEADMARFRLDRDFATVIIPSRSFQHLITPDEQRAALAAIRSHLQADGRLVLNLYDPRLDLCLPDSPPRSDVGDHADPESGRRVRRSFLSRSTDPLSQTLRETIRLELFDKDGTKLAEEETSWSLRWTYRQEMRYLLELTGFAVEEAYSDFRGSPPAYAREQVWVARAV